MTKKNFDINKLRVASPCSVPWETMTGDERIRHCHSCKMNIYNISEMTKTEVENLIGKREDRICIRLYKRADGTVLTKDCPVGFRAYQKRVARFAGAALTAILGLFSVSFGQRTDKNTIEASEIKIIKTENQNQKSILYGVVTDRSGAVIPNAEIKLLKKGEKKPTKTDSNSEGNYIFTSLKEGIYQLEIKCSGFKKLKIKNLKIGEKEKNMLDIVLKITGGVTVGIYADEPMIDTTSSSVTTTITQKMIEKLPR